MSEKDIKAEYKKPQQLAHRLKEGTLDAYFTVAGWPEGAVAALAATTEVDLVPIDGPETQALVKQYSFFAADEIPDGAYKNVAGAKTISVNAIWDGTPARASCSIPVMPRAARSSSNRRCRGSAFRCTWGRRSSTRRRGLIK